MSELSESNSRLAKERVAAIGVPTVPYPPRGWNEILTFGVGWASVRAVTET